MPKISEFYGITIYMFYADHNPPHFHAKYGKYEVIIEIKNLSIVTGKLPSRALGMVVEWASIHSKELLENWNLSKSFETLKKISPLK